MSEATASRLAAEMDSFLKFVRARVADRETALDVLQDAFVKALDRTAELRDDDKAVAWFYAILRSTIADLGRRRSAEARWLDRNADTVDGAVAAPEPDELMARDCLRRILPLLRPEHAELLERVDLGGEAPAAFAARQGITDAAFRVRRHRARQALRRAVEAVCRCLIDRETDCVCATC
jgi:RNA polymerase sigma-70 factor (ECF subfamily)